MPKDYRSTVIILTLGLLAVGCQIKVTAPSTQNLVTLDRTGKAQEIGDADHRFTIFGPEALEAAFREGKLVSSESAQALELLKPLLQSIPLADNTEPPALAPSPSLIAGFPRALVGEQLVFGGVITQVSDTGSEKLGGLKLADVPPIHVRALIHRTANEPPRLVLIGCLSACDEATPLLPILSIPIVAIDPTGGQLALDLSAIGSRLNLVEQLDPEGEYTELKTLSSRTVAFDYSMSTLVFDVEVRLVPKNPEVPQTPVTMTGRWYLKLGSGFNPAFIPRPERPEVGFFLTDRAAQKKIQRFARPSSVGGIPLAVKYFVKNVPDAYKPAFAAAFDAWNAKFNAITGGPIFEYEFIDTHHPLSRLLVTGDVRFNILEWDLTNRAPYGGLGPSIANQYTGELFSANVLIQGPHIIQLYKKWFEATHRAEELRSVGRVAEAETLLLQTKRDLDKATPDLPKLTLRLGDIPLRISALSEPLHDPIMQRDDFEPLPPNVTFERYMAGYFYEMVSHELGHNLGLRHNFRGNLLAKPTLEPASVSASIMEYLGRGFRYLNDIGSYDEMAIRYGYLGIPPDKAGLFCTDEHVAEEKTDTLSPECSRDDATADPFGYFETRLDRAIALLMLPGSAEAPVWTPPDMERELKTAVRGLGLYALGAAKTGGSWTNFFNVPNRPASPAEVKGYVLGRLKAKVCAPELTALVEMKLTPEAKQKTLSNLQGLREKVAVLLKPMALYSDSDLACAP